MKTAAFVLVALLGLAGSSCATDNSGVTHQAEPWDAHFSVRFPREKTLAILSNRDLDWQSGPLGLEPYLSPNAESILPVTDEPTLATVRSWLRDEDRFALAHVLLTLSRKTGSCPISGSEWNTLRVKLRENGQVQYDPTQRDSLQRKWTAVAATSPDKSS